MPVWEEFNWGSRGPQYRVGGIIVAHFLWPQTVQVNLYGHDERNGMLLNVFHVGTPEAVDEVACDTVASLVADWTNGNYNNCWALNISSDRVVVTDVSTVDGPQSEVGVEAAGTLIGQVLPSQNTLAVKKSTGRKGRANRGDWYVWPATTAQVEVLDPNLFINAYVNTCRTELDALRVLLLASGFTLVVASQASGVTRVVKQMVVTDRLVDSQNRRGGGRGR